MPRLHLTDLSLKAIKPCDVPTTFWDKSLPAFGVRVGKHTKTFLIMRGRDRKRIAIGKYPAKQLKEAREEAKRLLLAPDTPQNDATVRQVFNTYLDTYIKPNYKPRTAAEVERLITKHAARLLHRPIADLETSDCTKICDELLETPGEANHFFGVLRTFMSWAEQRKLIIRSPLHGLSKPAKERSRERVLTRDEIFAVWRTAHSIAGHYGAIVKLLLLTGQRRGEIAGLRRSFLNADKTITLPPHLVKNVKRLATLTPDRRPILTPRSREVVSH